jgi:hypothetical protein
MKIMKLESGLDQGGAMVWSKVQDQTARFTSTVSYDRAGIMWSERGGNPKTCEAMADEAARINTFGDIPLIVITETGENRKDEYPSEALAKTSIALWGEMRAELLKMSTRSKHVLAAKSGHFVMLDQPDVVIDAIKELVNQGHEKTNSNALQ